MQFTQFKNLGIAAILATGLVFAAGYQFAKADPVEVATSLSEAGYDNVNVKDKYRFCLKNEVGTNFEATNSKGQEVQGHICESLLTKRITAIRKAAQDNNPQEIVINKPKI